MNPKPFAVLKKRRERCIRGTTRFLRRKPNLGIPQSGQRLGVLALACLDCGCRPANFVSILITCHSNSQRLDTAYVRTKTACCFKRPPTLSNVSPRSTQKLRYFRYVSAGHNPALLLRRSGLLALLNSTGVPVGMFPNAAWRQETVTLAPGELLCLYTDGLTEAVNVQEEEFGMERLSALVAGGHVLLEDLPGTRRLIRVTAEEVCEA